jgi:hypothetical protein
MREAMRGMDRRRFLGLTASAWLVGVGVAGCRGTQHAKVMSDCKEDMVGSHCAGAETFKPLVDQSVGKLLARQPLGVQPASAGAPAGPKRICFVGVENKSAEELGDFKEQLTQIIETRIVESRAFAPISRRFVEVGLRQCHLRPDELFVPAHQRSFLSIMEQQGQPFDYLLFATLTSGTTRSNSNSQRDYLLTLELVNIATGQPDRESATIRKSYHSTRVGKWIG